MFKFREERIALLRLYVEMDRIHRRNFNKPDWRDPNAMAVHRIVALGHLEGKPFNASTISSYLNIPRTTVMRKLERMQQEGMIEEKDHHYYLAPAFMNLPDEVYLTGFEAIQRFTHELSEMQKKKRIA